MTLHHITVESGQTRIAPRSKVSDDIVNRLKPMLACAIELQKAGNSAHVALTPSDWYIKATEQKNAQGLTVGLW